MFQLCALSVILKLFPCGCNLNMLYINAECLFHLISLTCFKILFLLQLLPSTSLFLLADQQSCLLFLCSDLHTRSRVKNPHSLSFFLSEYFLHQYPCLYQNSTQYPLDYPLILSTSTYFYLSLSSSYTYSSNSFVFTFLNISSTAIKVRSSISSSISNTTFFFFVALHASNEILGAFVKLLLAGGNSFLGQLLLRKHFV